MSKHIDFHFDYISPFAYLAWHRLMAMQARHKLVVTPHPVLFAGLLNAHDNVGPAEVEPKRRYIFRHCQRIAQKLSLPLCCPPSHPFRPLLPLRLTLAVTDAEQRKLLVTALLDYLWAEGEAIDADDAVRELIGGLGLDEEELLAAAASDTVKKQLADDTQRAVDAGIFGVPSMMYEGELFWGYDSLDQLEARLEGAAPPDDAEFKRWCAIKPSARRRS